VALGAKATVRVERLALVPSPITRVTVTPAAGAGVDKLTAKGADWPRANVVEAGIMIWPGWAVVIVTVAGALEEYASLTINWIT
jgi:hypothetical protein